MASPLVVILMGSDSDLPVMAGCAGVLEEYGISYDIKVLSAHRTPDAAVEMARDAAGKGIKLFVCGAGGAAHLAGVVAAHTPLPVIGVPIASSPLAGFDSLLSTVQMPPGIPVATVGVGPMGSANAGHLVASILGLADAALREKLVARRAKMAQDVLKKNADLPAKLRDLLDKKK
jgi:phosphoribosylaminoimidazole carboxylase PurE protein